jgi:hypothetical protein
MNPQVMLAGILARSVHEDEWRRADEWRRLHRRPDALPLPAEPEPAPSRVAQLRMTLRRTLRPTGA